MLSYGRREVLEEGELNMKLWKTETEKVKQLPYANFFHQIPGIKSKDLEILLEHYENCEGIYLARSEEIEKLVGEKKAADILSAKKGNVLREAYGQMEQKGISFVCRQSPEYPEKLREIPDAPYGIYLLGDLPDNEKKSVAIIGARNCSQYGAHMAGVLGKELALAGMQVISGMAKGIDGISQQAALNAGGKSFGVLGSGVDVCYPSSNKGLYRQLVETGGVLSEYPPGSVPRPDRFPPRNRIISGLSDVVIVVEAKQKSGTLITVDMALEQGREIYCVPGRVTDKLSEGCNKLIGQGAGIVLSVEDFLEKTGLLEGAATTLGNGGNKAVNAADALAKAQLGEQEYVLWKLLDYEPISMDQLYIQLVSQKGFGQISMQEMMGMLTNLVLLDRAENIGGCYYAKKG